MLHLVNWWFIECFGWVVLKIYGASSGETMNQIPEPLAQGQPQAISCNHHRLQQSEKNGVWLVFITKSLHIYTFVVSRAFMAGGLAKQESLTPPGHLVSPLVCRGPWMSNVVLYCWCHSDSASVLLYTKL